MIENRGRNKRFRIMNSFFIFVSCAMSFLTGCNGSNQEAIHVNGELEETIEVFSDYVDKGITYPTDKYELIVDGKVVNTTIGKYQIKYLLYTKEGELKKELHRFVNVVDTTSPTYKQIKEKTYYVGFEYSISDFVEYSDNYYPSETIKASLDTIYFYREGKKNISFTLTDGSGNKTLVELSIIPVFDFYELARRVAASSVSTGNNGQSEYVRIMISNMSGGTQNMYYYQDTKSLHYLVQEYSSLGNYASVQISAKFGEFNKANLTFNVSGDFGDYKAGFSTIDATKTEGSITSFRSYAGTLNVDEGRMLEECNSKLPSALRLFHKYMSETLHLDIY